MDNMLRLTILALLLWHCSEPPQKEAWVNTPLSDSPNIALTNTIQFQDKTYKQIANAFLVRTETDTFAVTAKHLFLIFKQDGLEHIALGEKFIQWHMHPKGQPEIKIETDKLINANNKEKIGEFRTLKVRDWIAFRIKTYHPKVYPLKIREKPVSKGEILHAIGWAKGQETKEPSRIEMKVYKNVGDYYYTQTLTEGVNPVGRSGSPVIDHNGYLVGIVSGATGELGVIGSVNYLTNMFDTFETPEY